MDSPNTPSNTRVNSDNASAAPHGPPPAYWPKMLRMSPSPAALDHGVPVWSIWKANDGSHGRKASEPAAMATKHDQLACWLSTVDPGVSRLARSNNHSPATATT